MRVLMAFVLAASCESVSALVVLQYHHISAKTPTDTSIAPARFRAHLDYIQQAGFSVMDIRDLRARLQDDAGLPDKSVVITFDDGYRSVYVNAYPELARRQWPFAVFVNTKAHDEKNPLYMSWDELREMSQRGAVIANHTDSHPHLIRQQRYENHRQWQRRRQREIGFAEQRIKEEIGRSYRLFAYPFGEYDQALKRHLREEGYLAFGQQSGPIAANSHHQVLPRFPFGGVYGGGEDFATKLLSLPFPQSRVKVTADDGKVLPDPELPAAVGRPVLRIASPLLPYLDGVACYASGQGKIEAEIRGAVLVAQAMRDLPPGRSRYNCTARAGGGRFYWYSQLFIRRHADGSWVNE